MFHSYRGLAQRPSTYWSVFTSEAFRGCKTLMLHYKVPPPRLENIMWKTMNGLPPLVNVPWYSQSTGYHNPTEHPFRAV